jgi:hypothetical protein
MIDDRTAQRIASDWHSGQSSALYALASTGAIADHALHEIDCLSVDAQSYEDYETVRSEIDDIWDYCESNGPRGPVPGWYESTIAVEP